MKLYKLTDANDQTYGGCQWGENVEHTASGEGDLCDAGWLHAYTDPLLAVLLNPIHANVTRPHLWEAEGEVGKEHHGLKVGCTKLRTLRRVSLPQVTPEQRVRFGILCTKQIYDEPNWNAWADKWLSGKDRSKEAAWTARAAAAAAEAAWTAAAAAARAAAWAAWASAAAVPRAAARAAVRATARATNLDLAGLARQAVETES